MPLMRPVGLLLALVVTASCGRLQASRPPAAEPRGGTGGAAGDLGAGAASTPNADPFPST